MADHLINKEERITDMENCLMAWEKRSEEKRKSRIQAQQSYSKAGVVWCCEGLTCMCHLLQIGILLCYTIKPQQKKLETVCEPDIFVNYFQ